MRRGRRAFGGRFYDDGGPWWPLRYAEEVDDDGDDEGEELSSGWSAGIWAGTEVYRRRAGRATGTTRLIAYLPPPETTERAFFSLYTRLLLFRSSSVIFFLFFTLWRIITRLPPPTFYFFNHYPSPPHLSVISFYFIFLTLRYFLFFGFVTRLIGSLADSHGY